jgi:hypothetical protein
LISIGFLEPVNSAERGSSGITCFFDRHALLNEAKLEICQMVLDLAFEFSFKASSSEYAKNFREKFA